MLRITKIGESLGRDFGFKILDIGTCGEALFPMTTINSLKIGDLEFLNN